MFRPVLAIAAFSSLLAATPAAPQGRPIVMNDPDGRIFVATDDGGARHAGTGFVCPSTFNGAPRRGLYIFDTSDRGRDIACGYGKAGSDAWYTVYLSKQEAVTSRAVFEKSVRDEQRASPVEADVAAPMAPGLPPLPERAAFWQSKGKVDGLWFTSIGSWHVQLLTTYVPGHEAEVIGVAKAVWAQVFDQVRGPEA